jgi:hypothetical protein
MVDDFDRDASRERGGEGAGDGAVHTASPSHTVQSMGIMLVELGFGILIRQPIKIGEQDPLHA